MQTEVKIREREPQLVLSRRFELRLADIGRVIGSGLGQAYGYLAARHARSTESPFVIYHGIPGPTNLPFEIELCVPVGADVEAPEGWQRVELPGGSFASVVHIGSYDTIGAAYDVLDDWIATHELVIAGPAREVYLSDRSTAPAETKTVVEFPVDLTAALQPVG